ncbi:MAG: outer membrane protein transport protein [Bacteroidetes bacterium]|nr:outer membrane protein transport protein [Bacteroidota bacterium]
MKKILITLLIAITANTISFAQNEIDALRYSQLFYGGTARSTAMGGAFGALGADFSSLSLNPGGIGLYKISEFTFSPSFYTGKTSSIFNNSQERDDFKYNFNLGNAGFVYTFYKRGNYAEGPGFKAAQFGFGINRLNNFNNRMIMEGFNESSSMLNQYVSKANGVKAADLNSFDTQLAYDAYLINPKDSTHYTSVVNRGVLQRKSVTSGGSTNELVISLGGNYSDKLYIGATLGFPFIRYSEQSSYKETDSKDTINNFNSFTVTDNLNTSGAGINFKFGMIYRPIDMIRIGVAFHSPTYYYAMQDEYSRRIESDLASNGKYNVDSPKGSFDYELTTPYRFIGSLAFVLNEYGLISADYEFVDYTLSRLRSDTYDFSNENDAIQAKYNSASNLRIGTEWRLNQLAFRAGYAYYGNPYWKNVNVSKRTVISAGLGFREKDFFVDLAYSYSKQDEDYYFYNPSVIALNPVKNSMIGSNIMMTIGFKY